VGRVFAGIVAVIGAAALTLGAMVVLVQSTILFVSIQNLPLRIFAIIGDVLLGTVLLVGCIYLATHLAVRIMGVGRAEFPPLPDQMHQDDPLASVQPPDSAVLLTRSTSRVQSKKI